MPLVAQNALLTIDDIYPEETESGAFTINSAQDVKIEAIGSHVRGKYEMLSNAWILDSGTREVVWELADATSKWKDRHLRSYTDEIRLEAGQYEVYYSSFPPNHYRHDGWNISRMFFGPDDREDYEDSYRDYSISIFANGSAISGGQVNDMQNSIKEKAVVSLFAERDERFLEQGFTLDRDMDLIVYSLGELRDDGAFDYGWIINSDTRERVWQFRYRRSDHAGGAKKNRVARNEITLPAGNYAAFYTTDDSHAPR